MGSVHPNATAVERAIQAHPDAHEQTCHVRLREPPCPVRTQRTVGLIHASHGRIPSCPGAREETPLEEAPRTLLGGVRFHLGRSIPPSIFSIEFTNPGSRVWGEEARSKAQSRMQRHRRGPTTQRVQFKKGIERRKSMQRVAGSIERYSATLHL